MPLYRLMQLFHCPVITEDQAGEEKRSLVEKKNYRAAFTHVASWIKNGGKVLCQVSCGEKNQLWNHSLVTPGWTEPDTPRETALLPSDTPKACCPHGEISAWQVPVTWGSWVQKPQELWAEIITLQEILEHQKGEKKVSNLEGEAKARWCPQNTFKYTCFWHVSFMWL